MILILMKNLEKKLVIRKYQCSSSVLGDSQKKTESDIDILLLLVPTPECKN